MTPHALPSVRVRGEVRSAQGAHAATVMPSRSRGHAFQPAAARVTAPGGHPWHATARKEGSMLIEHVLYQAQVKATGAALVTTSFTLVRSELDRVWKTSA